MYDDGSDDGIGFRFTDHPKAAPVDAAEAARREAATNQFIGALITRARGTGKFERSLNEWRREELWQRAA